MKYHTFRGRKYRIKITEDMPDDELGYCTPPGAKKPEIGIRPTQSLVKFVSTGLHEGLHACLWDLNEDAVMEIEDDLIRFITRLVEYHIKKGLNDEHRY